MYFSEVDNPYIITMRATEKVFSVLKETTLVYLTEMLENIQEFIF